MESNAMALLQSRLTEAPTAHRSIKQKFILLRHSTSTAPGIYKAGEVSATPKALRYEHNGRNSSKKTTQSHDEKVQIRKSADVLK